MVGWGGHKVNMHRSERHELKFSPEDIVLHRMWGAGRVLEAGESCQGDVIVDFPGNPGYRMSLEIAGRALSKLPPDGLEAFLLKEPDKVRNWSQNAPLKLIGATLADLARPAKAADLRGKLDSRNILRTKWKSWWKRVQPALRQSPHFRLGSDATYQLTSAVDQIPESPLPSLPKRTRAERMGGAQLQEVAARLESGEIGFESLKGAESLRLIAKEVIQRSVTSEGARNTVNRALAGPVLPARIILEELLRSGRPGDLVEALIQLTKHIQDLATSPAKEKGKGVGKHVIAKARLLKETTRELALDPQLGDELSLLSGLVKALLQSALAIWRREMGGWRSEAVDCLSNALAVLAERQPGAFDIIGEYLAGYEGSIASRLGAVESLLAKVPPGTQSSAVDRLLVHSLAGTPKFAEECFSRYVSSEEQLLWISSIVSRILSSCDTRTIQVLVGLLLKTRPRLDQQELRTWTQLAIVMSSVSSQAEAALSPIIMEGLRECLKKVALETPALALQAKPKTVLSSIEVAHRSRVEQEREQFRSVRTSLESEIKMLRTGLEASKGESEKLQAVVKQLQSSYRLPERWASFEGKKEILKNLAELYQEAFLAKDSGGAAVKYTSWVLQQLEGMLQRQGVSKFGQVESCESYDPSLHKYIPGFEGASKEVKIKCPGFEWQDPADNRIILARAKVMES